MKFSNTNKKLNWFNISCLLISDSQVAIGLHMQVFPSTICQLYFL